MNDPQVIRFSNEMLRPVMLDIVRLHMKVRQLIEYYDALGLEAKLAGDLGRFEDYLEDGSPQDGRPPITAGGVVLAVQNIKQFLAQMEHPDPRSKTGLTFVKGAYAMSPFVPSVG